MAATFTKLAAHPQHRKRRQSETLGSRAARDQLRRGRRPFSAPPRHPVLPRSHAHVLRRDRRPSRTSAVPRSAPCTAPQSAPPLHPSQHAQSLIPPSPLQSSLPFSPCATPLYSLSSLPLPSSVPSLLHLEDVGKAGDLEAGVEHGDEEKVRGHCRCAGRAHEGALARGRCTRAIRRTPSPDTPSSPRPQTAGDTHRPRRPRRKSGLPRRRPAASHQSGPGLPVRARGGAIPAR